MNAPSTNDPSLDQTAALDRRLADEYAGWFRCLADGTRIRVLSVVARAGRALTVGEVVAAVGRSQSTVSRHLRILADEGFVIAEQDGIRTLIRVDESCMTLLPAAARAIMGGAEERPTARGPSTQGAPGGETTQGGAATAPPPGRRR